MMAGTHQQDDIIHMENDEEIIGIEDEEEDRAVKLDNDIFERLKKNDPAINNLYIYYDRSKTFFNSIDWKADGDCIANNTQLKKLRIYCALTQEEACDLPTRQQIQYFFSCIYQNSSIEEFFIGSFHVFGYQFVGGLIEGLQGHPSITRLEISSMENISCAALGKVLAHPRCKLKDLRLEWVGLEDKEIGILCDVLLGNSTLMKLCLNGKSYVKNGITYVGWQELSAVIRHPDCKLVDIELKDNGITDEALDLLGTALSGCSSVRALNLSYNKSISSEGWQTFLNHLGRLSIEKLHLNSNNIDNIGLASLARIGPLQSLDLGSNKSITPFGWRSFFNSLRTRETSLKELVIYDNIIGNEGILALGSLLVNMGTLKTLYMGSMVRSFIETNINITPRTWQMLFTSFEYSCVDLVKLDLSENQMDDEGIQILTRVVSSMHSLKHLNLGYNRVTSTGWLALIDFLQSQNFALKSLDLDGSNIDNDTVIAFTSALAGNKTLELLFLYNCTDDDDNALITERGWAAVSTLLCNNSSIMDTCNSNHTLRCLSDGDDYDEMNLPDNLELYLKLNENKNMTEVARQKILQTYFSTDNDTTSNIQELLDMELEVMPTAISWIGRSKHIGWSGKNVSGLSTMFNLMRRLPDLFDLSAQKKPSATKRKREML